MNMADSAILFGIETPVEDLPDDTIKTCCAAVYQSEWIRLLIGDSLHPGGLVLTEQLGLLTDLGPDHKILDVASGTGATAFFLAQQFGCQVVGLEYGHDAVVRANAAAQEHGLADKVRFEQGDAEKLPFAGDSFDVVICECAFCTFPNKSMAASELSRVLRPGGRLGLSDITLSGQLPHQLEGLMSWVACIADAKPIDQYVDYLESAGLRIAEAESHDEALLQTVRDIRSRLFAIELLIKLKKIELTGVDFERAKEYIQKTDETIRQGILGYAILVAARPQT
jgi:ubiquinone/menaquinone biosynthesis C-methylase UbiE